MILDTTFIVSALNSDVISVHGSVKDPQFSIDSRTLKSGQIFVALKGAQGDGHDYVDEALQKGAVGLIYQSDHTATAEKKFKKDFFVCAVRDTRDALIQLARVKRANLVMPVVGVTGSLGKTTTKEIICAILTAAKKSYTATYQNQNTILGIALTLLHAKETDDALVLEMGISSRHEMERLAELARPTVAVITTIAHSHMQGLGSLTDIATEKRAIFKFFKNDNIGIVNGDVPLLTQVSYPHPIVKFGLKTTNQIQARKVSIDGTQLQCILKIYGRKESITLNHIHAGYLMNLLAAVSVAHVLQIEHSAIIRGISERVTIPGRFNVMPMKRWTGALVDDGYNASPESMKAALVAFDVLPTSGQKIAVLGDMLELGLNSSFWHRQVGRFMRKLSSVKEVILVGSNMKAALKTMPIGVRAQHVETWSDAIALLDTMKQSQELCVLVKGSHAIGFEQFVKSVTG